MNSSGNAAQSKKAHYSIHQPRICGIARLVEGYGNGDQRRHMNLGKNVTLRDRTMTTPQNIFR